MGALYDALRASSEITEEQARQAAEEVAGYDHRMAAVERELTVLKWMVGTNIALTLLSLSTSLGVLLQMGR